MKKTYSLILFLSITLLTYSQGPEFKVDFEGANPLTTLPSGITSVNPPDFFETPESPGVFSDSIVAFIANNSHYFIEEGGDLVRTEIFTQRNQFDNIVKDVDGNKLLQTDYTGHIVIDETALGTSSYSIRLNLSVFGHRMGGTDCGIFTITGNNAGTYEADFITARNGGFTTGFGDSTGTGGALGFAYGQLEPAYREIVVTYNDTDKLYRVYIEGVEQILSESAQTSGDWTDRKFYIGFAGRNSVGSGGTDEEQAVYGTPGASLIDPTTGVFTKNAIRTADGRVADLQMRMDNIEVYQRAITDSEVLKLFTDGSLAFNEITKEYFDAYPNPVVDYLNFSTDDISSVEIYNTLGAKFSTQEIVNKVDMTQFSQGVYIVKCKNKSEAVVSIIKVIKK